MDRAQSKLPNTASRLIAMAASLTGDPQSVKKAMLCSDADFLDYCAGAKEPPWHEMDRLITLMVREQGRLIAKNREFLKQTEELRRRQENK